jgi:ribosomal-protein-alanine N-acetyltransferase
MAPDPKVNLAMRTRPGVIETPRLRLIALLPDELRALIARASGRASALLGAHIPYAFPSDQDARAGLSWHLQALSRDPAQVVWRLRVAVERSQGAVLGSINLKGPPDAHGDVEIGWGIEPLHRQQGYALEAAAAVLEWALRQRGVVTVSATISVDNTASQRLAARLGMRLTQDSRRGLPLWMHSAAHTA